jgi:hypothetical protein
VRQDLSPDGDAYAAGRDLHINNYYPGGARGAGQVAGLPDGVAGRLLADVTDAFALEVHRPVEVGEVMPGLDLLPAYVPRGHDRVLGDVARAAAGGLSGLAVLVGGSSTGKTRACWEALDLPRKEERSWRLWHPIDPGHAEAALRELPLVGPRTVIWLNEAQFYLGQEGGEQVAAGLRTLLGDPARAPVLVLATLWPEHWRDLAARPSRVRLTGITRPVSCWPGTTSRCPLP